MRCRPRPALPWGDRFGRAAVVVTVVGLAANILSIVARGLAAGRLPLGNMYEFTSVICAAAVLCWLIVLARTGARTMGMFVMLPVVVLLFVAGTVLYVPAAPGGAGAELVLEVDPRHHRRVVVQRADGQRRGVGAVPAARPLRPAAGRSLSVRPAAGSSGVRQAALTRRRAGAKSGGFDARPVAVDGDPGSDRLPDRDRRRSRSTRSR